MRSNDFELTIAYERDVSGHLTATIPALPGAISSGSTRDEARTNVLDALQELLSVPPDAPQGGNIERVRVRLEVTRNRDLGRGI